MKKKLTMVLAVAMAAAFVAGGCGDAESGSSGASSAGSAEASKAETTTETAQSDGSFSHLTEAQIKEITDTIKLSQSYQDSTMEEAVSSEAPDSLKLTDDEIAQIKEMNLKIAVEFGQMSDPTKWEIAGIEQACEELGITIGDTWIAEETQSQLKDYQNFEAVAQNYDCLFTIPLDVSQTGEQLKTIMTKTNITYMCSVPYGVDWNDSHFGGCSDANAYEAGAYSAQALVDELGGQGTIAMIGYKAGREGTFATCFNRYEGWDYILEQNPGISVIEAWYADAADVSSLVESTLAANPEIKAVLIDWANTPGDQCQQVLQQLGYTAWDDMTMVTIDMDDAIAIPMATDGVNGANMCSAFVAQDWTGVGYNSVYLFANHLLKGNDAPKYVTADPMPVATYDNLKSVYEAAVPQGWNIPDAIVNLENQWPLP